MNGRGTRRFSQAISEGDGISVLVEVEDPESARTAETQGAEGIAVRGPLPGVRDASELPILWCANGIDAALEAGADAYLLDVALHEGWEHMAEESARVRALGLESVVAVRDEEQLQLALELDPEIVLLSARSTDPDADPLDHVLELLPDVPAGKLAVAELSVAGRDEIVALERAGVDGVLVGVRDVSALVGEPPPDV